ncbi:hypothetical protein [Yoonia sp. R2-816]|uniref:hypothetical protein n=1 Tax=Yoonia sp. R2-816 TaxID=3342638 RepID=UPI00372BDB43
MAIELPTSEWATGNVALLPCRFENTVLVAYSCGQDGEARGVVICTDMIVDADIAPLFQMGGPCPTAYPARCAIPIHLNPPNRADIVGVKFSAGHLDEPERRFSGRKSKIGNQPKQQWKCADK